MKPVHFWLAAALFSFSACTSNHIEFNGTAPGLTNAVFLVKNGKDELFSDAITKGTFHKSGILETPGYYTLDIMNNSDTKVHHDPYEVYLEPGTYTIEAHTADLNVYPKINSTSKTQQDLSAYYAILEEKTARLNKALNELSNRVDKKAAPLVQEMNTLLYSKLLELQNQKSKMSLLAYREFMQGHPKSDIAAHLMDRLDYESDPAPFYTIYQHMSQAAKDSPEGQELGPKLKSLISLLPGAYAPDIAGATPEGKKFNPKALDKQIYVIDFWRAGNEVSRLNHQDMVGKLISQLDMKKVGFISVSLDSRRDWWTTAIKDDHLTWPQYSDLKGNNSTNVQSWVITSMPTYYLIDSDWHVLQRDITFSRINFEVNDYLKHHHSHSNHPVMQYTKNMVSGQMPYSYAAGKFTK